MSSWTYTASNEANLMKIKYAKLIEKQFNMDNVLFGRIKKSEDFVGSQKDYPVVQSIGGGVGAGTLPTANENKISKASLATKKLYAVVSIDRETMKAAKTDEGSFVRMTKYPVKIATKSFNRNLERMLTRAPLDGSGKLVTGDAGNRNVSKSGSVYTVAFNAAGVYSIADIESIEIGDIVQVTGETAQLEVTDIVVNSSVPGSIDFDVKLTILSSASAILDADDGLTPLVESLHMQGSENNELAGLEGIISATSGSYKGISIGRRWQSYSKNAGAALSTDLMNDVVINVKRQSGESPDLILSSYHQYTKLLNILEDQKRYNLPARDKKYKGQISFSGLEYMSMDGAIPVIASRFVSDDKMLFLNTKHIELCCRPGGFEWFDEDGTVFLRESGDSYEARYGGYADFFVNPHFQGQLENLTV